MIIQYLVFKNEFISRKGVKLKLIQVVILFTILTSSSGQIAWEKLNGPVEIDILASCISQNGKIFQFTNPYGMYSSIDKGNSWQETNKGLEAYLSSCNAYNYFFKVSPSGLIYFYDGCRLYRYDDLSIKWIKINDNCSLLNFCFSSDETKIFAGDDSNFFFSSDSGKTFIKKASWWTHSLQIYSFGIDSNIVELNNGASYGRYKFNDHFDKFTEVSNGGGGGPLIYDKYSGTLFSFEYWEFKKSRDFGKTWEKIYIDSISGFYCSYASFMKDSILYIFANNNYVSFDQGKSWQTDSTYPLLGSYASSAYVSFTKEYEFVLNNYNASAYFSPKKELIPLDLPIAKPNISSILPLGNDRIICNTTNNVYLSLDGGKIWKIIGKSNENVLGFSNGDLLKIIAKRIFQISTNQGNSWTDIPLPKNLRSRFTAITNKDEIFICNNDTNYLYSKSDKNWIAIPNRLNYSFEGLNLSSNNILYSKVDDSIYYSSDYGLSQKSFLAHEAYENYCFLSKNNIFYWTRENFNINGSELYFSEDFGKTNTMYIPFKSPDQLLLLDHDDRIYICRNNRAFPSIQISSVINNFYDCSEFDGIEKSYFDCVDNLVIDNNGFLYCSVPGQPVYKSIKSINLQNGIDNNNINSNFQIKYLNDLIIVEFQHDIQLSNYKVILLDAMGQELSKMEILNDQIFINTSDYLPGIYYLQIIGVQHPSEIQKIFIF